MIIRQQILVKINSKNKIQYLTFELHQYSESYFSINRASSQFEGKSQWYTPIIIRSGKSKRSIVDQATLKFNSLINFQENKGYKKYESLTSIPFSKITQEQLINLFNSNGDTDQKGIPKPMLAKSSNDLSSNIFEKEVFVSRKIDGVRCLMYYKDRQILTSSRGGKDYNESMIHLRTNPTLLQFFQAFPNIILDGELYKFGWTLQKISGLCRLQEPTEECAQIEFWVYDYISDEPFYQRYINLMKWRDSFDDPFIKVLDHYKLSGWTIIKRYHDQFVREGFEGLCARVPDKEYGIGKRSGLYLWKLKEYLDDEFKIIGVREGFRPEDMCFVLETKTKRQFAAKPACPAEQRIEYLQNKEKYIGKMGTCKFFYYSEDHVPLQPIFINIRPEDE